MSPNKYPEKQNNLQCSVLLLVISFKNIWTPSTIIYLHNMFEQTAVYTTTQ